MQRNQAHKRMVLQFQYRSQGRVKKILKRGRRFRAAFGSQGAYCLLNAACCGAESQKSSVALSVHRILFGIHRA